MYQMSNFKQH